MFRVKNIVILAVLLGIVALFAVAAMAQDKDQPSTGTTPVTPSQPTPTPEKGKAPAPAPVPPPAVPAPNPNENQPTPTAMPGTPPNNETTPVIPPPPAPAPKRPLLDDKIFEGKLTTQPTNNPQGDKTLLDETLAFKDGKIRSAAFEPQGYKACPYTAKNVSGKITFTGKVAKANDPTAFLIWKGTVAPDAKSPAVKLIGTATLIKMEKELKVYNLDAVQQTTNAPIPK